MYVNTVCLSLSVWAVLYVEWKCEWAKMLDWMEKVSILEYGLEVVESKMAGARMAGVEMAGAASAWVWTRGSGTDLWYRSPKISAHHHRVLGASDLAWYS